MGLEKDRRWDPLEHEVYRVLRQEGIRDRSLLIAASGGLDSQCLIEILEKLGPALGLRLRVAHVHHGPSLGEQRKFRKKAQDLVRRLAEEKGLDFVTNSTRTRVGSDEAALRKFRYERLRSWAKADEFLVLAHHRDDLLETRIHRLIRGVGPQGLGAMEFREGDRLRPLLAISRKELESYARRKKLTWLEDPSNQDETHLRNWLRRRWLPLLEKRQIGSLQSLARSLDTLAGQTQVGEAGDEDVWTSSGLRRPVFLVMNGPNQRRVLALVLRRLGRSNYTAGQVSELLRLLLRDQKEFKFDFLGSRWIVNARFIRWKDNTGLHLKPL